MDVKLETAYVKLREMYKSKRFICSLGFLRTMVKIHPSKCPKLWLFRFKVFLLTSFYKILNRNCLNQLITMAIIQKDHFIVAMAIYLRQ